MTSLIYSRVDSRSASTMELWTASQDAEEDARIIDSCLLKDFWDDGHLDYDSHYGYNDESDSFMDDTYDPNDYADWSYIGDDVAPVWSKDSEDEKIQQLTQIHHNEAQCEINNIIQEYIDCFVQTNVRFDALISDDVSHLDTLRTIKIEKIKGSHKNFWDDDVELDEETMKAITAEFSSKIMMVHHKFDKARDVEIADLISIRDRSIEKVVNASVAKHGEAVNLVVSL